MSRLILIVGAGGWLGRQVLAELCRAGVPARALLRGGKAHPKAADIAALGGEIVAGDLADEASLRRATEGVHTIISTVQGGPDIVVGGQVALAAAGGRNGAARIFTSDYAVRFDGITEAEHLFLGWRARANAAIAGAGLSQVNPLNGAFMEMLAQPFFGLVDWGHRAVTFWGDPDQPYQFTLTENVAAYVAAAAQDRDLADGAFEIVGDTASPRKLAALASETSGADFALTCLGSLEALDAEIARRKGASPSDPTRWVGLQYHRLMANGAGFLHAPQNARYPDITPRPIRNFMSTRR
jgi:uncharacterized protein YbjT (DUF2867 family)